MSDFHSDISKAGRDLKKYAGEDGAFVVAGDYKGDTGIAMGGDAALLTDAIGGALMRLMELGQVKDAEGFLRVFFDTVMESWKHKQDGETEGTVQ